MEFVTIIGLSAGTFTTFAMAPQAYKVFKTGHVTQISLRMLMLMFGGVILWLWYGLMISYIAILWANGVNFFFVTYMLVMKLRDLIAQGWRPGASHIDAS